MMLENAKADIPAFKSIFNFVSCKCSLSVLSIVMLYHKALIYFVVGSAGSVLCTCLYIYLRFCQGMLLGSLNLSEYSLCSSHVILGENFSSASTNFVVSACSSTCHRRSLLTMLRSILP